MNVLRYLKKNGLRYALQVLWQYKLSKLQCSLLLPFLRRLPLLDAIVIESHNDFDSNGGAFYRYLVENGYHNRYRIVWLLKHTCPSRLPHNVTGVPLHAPSFRKAYYLCRARYLCFDSEALPKLRPDQTSVFCDHGAVALKSVQGVYSVPKDVDVFLSPSDAFSPVLAREYGVPEATDRFYPIGYPYHDVFFRQTPDERKKLTSRAYQKVIVWMPTFRKGGGHGRNDSAAELPYGIPLLETEAQYRALQQFLETENCLLILKIHPMQDPSTLALLRETENIRILTGQRVKELDIDNYRLVKSADALITDYSSIAFSYILLDRPMAFVLSDLPDYRRGFSMDNPEDFLVGHRIHTFGDLYSFLSDVLANRDPWQEPRRALSQWLYTHHDGDACRRLAMLLKLEK